MFLRGEAVVFANISLFLFYKMVQFLIVIKLFSFVFCLFVSSALAQKPQPQKEEANKAVSESEENFQPSLSATINDTNQLKKQIKRQLAREWKNDEEERDLQSVEEDLKEGAVAHFGDLEVSISKGDDEELERLEDGKEDDGEGFF